jgi:exodeoxyribonuclease V alpha subunit
MSEENEIIPNDEQENAIEHAVNNKFSVITGNAGSGKSTVIKNIAYGLGIDRIVLCCPTGKAAARLREATGLHASTIHSLLGYNGMVFNIKQIDKIVVVDEASMLDSWLMSSIIRANPPGIILVGDEAQLLPVGHGSPFHDIIKLRPDITNKLTICYRNKEAVFKAAMQIRNGNMPLKHDKVGGEVWQIEPTGAVEQTIERISSIVKSGSFDFATDIILCPKNDDVKAINKAMIDLVNPREDNGDEEKWKVGDRIICLKNFADIDTWNGTTGTITGIDGRGRAWVQGDIEFKTGTGTEPEMLWGKDVLNHSQHAYALTIHKSQGSQYRNVIFCSWQKDSFMLLSRSLIYTAITRAQKSCLVLGQPQSFYQGIKTIRTRQTIIQEFALQEKESVDLPW